MTYELGKWFPELGNYGEWEIEKLREFVKDHIVVKVEPLQTSTGSIRLLVDGYPKKESNASR